MAAAAADRTAAATEGIDSSTGRAAQALEAMATAPPPWHFEELSVDGDWRLINKSNSAAVTRRVGPENPELASILQMEGWDPDAQRVWLAGDWSQITNTMSGRLTSPGPITISGFCTGAAATVGLAGGVTSGTAVAKSPVVGFVLTVRVGLPAVTPLVAGTVADGAFAEGTAADGAVKP